MDLLRRLFGRGRAPEQTLNDTDALALKSMQNEWQCGSCQERHRGVMHLAADHPDPWPHGFGYEPNSALRTDGDFLSPDFCVIDGEHFMVRGVLELPVAGLKEPWTFGCWSSLSRENFDRYVAEFDSGRYDPPGPWFGWLCNALPPLSENGEFVALDVYFRSGRPRPLFTVTDPDHPLGVAQEGLSATALLEVLRARGHGPTTQ